MNAAAHDLRVEGIRLLPHLHLAKRLRVRLEVDEGALEEDAGLGGQEVAETVGGVVAAYTVFVGVNFQDVLGTGGVVLEAGQAFDEALATLESL